MAHRPIFKIAADIAADWKNVHFGAVPYLEAMHRLNSVDDRFYMDDAQSILRYSLANASTWRGDAAKAIKAEINAILKG